MKENKCGDDGLKDTPVSIPNTEVKLQNADSSWRNASCEDRKLPCELKAMLIFNIAFFCFIKVGINAVLSKYCPEFPIL